MSPKIDYHNQTPYVLEKHFYDLLEKIFDKILKDSNLSDKQCEVLLVDNATIQSFNKDYRNKDEITDVLSFPLKSEFSPLIGSVLISLDYAQSIANALKHSLEEEIALLFIHGILHLIGFDHERDEGEHRAKEEEIIHLFNLPQSLIMRNS
ncbi:rRNA maturation RNase YbeY [Helicobacter apodemus]|uniref:Endoribonuclease YbeY n=1 Tax=Helicobacter apodemus TaxID=135569 RepID=A0A2U8FE99_9HELI|nr:rRNA maturation RNase YbeY [Helicobacter apodemus]AWI34570.1 rRNA maturation RNase YbeY [Helicobacter apodemus]